MSRRLFTNQIGTCVLIAFAAPGALSAADAVDRFGVFEAEFTSAKKYANPYIEQKAEARLQRPDGSTWTLPLFWDGDNRWKLRVSPDLVGNWSYTVHSQDPVLDGKTGSFTCAASGLRGSIEPMDGFPRHFQYQNGQPMWFLGDTAWALLTDSAEEKHDRAAAETYLRSRAAQGFNVVHSMMLSEAGWGNRGGLPFEDLSAETINPGYWQEVDRRVKFANRQGIVVGLAIAWGDKRRQEPFAWRRFPNLAARKRYARYIAARYGACDVYFLVSGEWHGEVRTRPSSDAEMKREFVEIGDALAAADPHDRMIGIHPMSGHGSVREFNDVPWMSFGDYQQNYHDLHARILKSRQFDRPIVNSEYGYYLRDQDGDGTPDKENSANLESIRHASWDIAMAGGYLVTGFGTTYFGGHRDPGPFNTGAEKNDDWERQIGLIKRFFSGTNWWKLEPHDEWLACAVPHGADGKHLERLAPPASNYWLLAEPGRQYVVYARGLTEELNLRLGPNAEGDYWVRLFNPRTGAVKPVGSKKELTESYTWTPPDADDWILQLKNDAEERPHSRSDRPKVQNLFPLRGAERVLLDLDLSRGPDAIEGVQELRVEGGEWDDGWRVVGDLDRLLIDLGRDVTDGYFEVVVTRRGQFTFAERKRNWMGLFGDATLHETPGGYARAGDPMYAFSKAEIFSANEKDTICERLFGTESDWVLDDMTMHTVRAEIRDNVMTWTNDKGGKTSCGVPAKPVTHFRFAAIGGILDRKEGWHHGSLVGLRVKRITLAEYASENAASPPAEETTIPLVEAATASASHSAAAAGTLSVSSDAPPKLVNLSLEGQTDWAHWGYIHNDTILNRKADRPPATRELVKLGARELHTYENNPTAFTWSDGVSARDVKQTRSGVFTYGQGFELNLPADTKLRTAKVYCGLWRSVAKLEASLSDASVTPVAVVKPAHDNEEGDNVVFTIRYRAASAGQALNLKWINTANRGNVTFQAVALHEVAE